LRKDTRRTQVRCAAKTMRSGLDGRPETRSATRRPTTRTKVASTRT
jgi:hypothetical protein